MANAAEIPQSRSISSIARSIADNWRARYGEENFKCNDLPPGEETEVIVSPVMALAVQPADLKNPVLTVNGRTLWENSKDAINYNRDVVTPLAIIARTVSAQRTGLKSCSRSALAASAWTRAWSTSTAPTTRAAWAPTRRWR